MSRIAYCESRWDPTALNGQYRGLFQIGDEYYAYLWRDNGWNWTNPEHNTLAAIEVYKKHKAYFGDGFEAWSCY